MKPQYVTVKSDGTSQGTKIFMNGVELVNVKSMKLEASYPGMVMATLVLYVDRVEADGMMLVNEIHDSMSPRAADFEKKLETLNRLAGQMSPEDVEKLINSIGK